MSLPKLKTVQHERHLQKELNRGTYKTSYCDFLRIFLSFKRQSLNSLASGSFMQVNLLVINSLFIH